MVASKNNPKKNPSAKKKIKPGLLFIFIAIIPAIFYFLFFMNTEKTPEQLKGSWLRSDGPYTIEITEVQEDGKLVAKYFNPNPIKVGSSGWQLKDKQLQIFVELQDENYPGSLYKLTFDEKTKTLKGTYFQAVSKQTFEVTFTKKM